MVPKDCLKRSSAGKGVRSSGFLSTPSKPHSGSICLNHDLLYRCSSEASALSLKGSRGGPTERSRAACGSIRWIPSLFCSSSSSCFPSCTIQSIRVLDNPLNLSDYQLHSSGGNDMADEAKIVRLFASERRCMAR